MSRERGNGHGNAIAQGYSHSILPLLDPRGRELQIAWGIQDFVARFDRLPEGMWLPECAVDADTLKAVARGGIGFVMLGDDQGRFSRRGARQRSLFMAKRRSETDHPSVRSLDFGQYRFH